MGILRTRMEYDLVVRGCSEHTRRAYLPTPALQVCPVCGGGPVRIVEIFGPRRAIPP